MTQRQSIFVYGASGHAKVVIDIIENMGRHDIAFVVDDDLHLEGTRLCGYQVIGDRNRLLAQKDSQNILTGIVAIGNNSDRARVAAWLIEHAFQVTSAIHTSAQVARGVTIGENTVVMAGAVINPDTEIGAGVIINTAATVDHDCRIEDAVHIAPGCHVCGNVAIGTMTLIGAGTTIVPGVSIGERSVVGAGSVILADVPSNTVVAGAPARMIGITENQE